MTKIEEIERLHREAMALLDRSVLMRHGDPKSRWQERLREAFGLEKRAADETFSNFDFEPTRSVLHLGAASLAFQCDDVQAAESLIYRGLAGKVPEEIAADLKQLLDDVSFKRHLQVKGIELADDEFQVSIAGAEVGPGIAKSESFLTRVTNIEKMIFRTVERRKGKPYRERGQVAARLRRDFEVYLAAPRAASLAISFKVGATQQLKFAGFETAGEVIDELFTCLALFDSGDAHGLHSQISNPAYYRNFVGLATVIAPDGEDVTTVGLTAKRNGQSIEVALRTPQTRISAKMTAEPTDEGASPPQYLQGLLKAADATDAKRSQIKIVLKNKKRVTVSVPEGMMDDIVRPMWDTEVNVVARRRRKQLQLVSIKPSAP